MTKPIPYVAFLRGINVGGHKPIKMDALKKSFESMGFQNVKTILASGNVVFETTGSARNLDKSIGAKLEETFGHKVGVIFRTRDQISALVDSNPFKRVRVTPTTQRYVTFLSEESNPAVKDPYGSPEGDFKILTISPTEVCSIVTPFQKRGTTEFMSILEKHFGRNITTRNWNTLLKIVKQ